MFKYTLLVSVLAVGVSVAQAEDAVPTFTGDAIVVTASRQAQPLSKTLADTTVITRDQILKSSAQSLLNLLSRQAGISFSQNGGSGSTSSLYLRGTNDDHTLILLDGMRIASTTLGTAALEQIPLDQIERIEIVRGPASSLYGADAIGGVIQIFTRQQGSHVDFGVGDHGTVKMGAGWANTFGNTHLSLNGSVEHSDGFSATNPKSYSYNPDNDGYDNQTYHAKLSHTFAPGQIVSAQLYQTWAKTEFDQSPTSYDYTKSRVMGQKLESVNQITDRWKSTMSLTRNQSKDTTYGTFPSFIESTRNEWSWQNDLNLDIGKITLGSSYREEEAENQSVFNATRHNKALFAIYQNQWDKHLFQTSVRRDQDSIFGGKTTGQVSYGYRLNTNWLARASIGTAYKAPTFNDLFYPNYGNPDLKPESSRNQEISLRYQQNQAFFTATAFQNKVSNLIASVNMGQGIYKAQNVDKATLTGLELEGGFHYWDIDWKGNVTFLNPHDDSNNRWLDRRARQQLNLSASKTMNAWTTGIEFSAVSQRNDSNGTQILHGYSVTNIFADYKIDRSWTLTGRLNNIFDREYETAYGYNTGHVGGFLGVRYVP